MASLAILLLARFSSSIAVSSNSYISRSTEQQVIAAVAPAVVPDVDGQSAQPFLTSPSGSFAAYLRRAVDSAGGLGGDTCYVQVQQAGAGGSVWESDCTPVARRRRVRPGLLAGRARALRGRALVVGHRGRRRRPLDAEP